MRVILIAVDDEDRTYHRKGVLEAASQLKIDTLQSRYRFIDYSRMSVERPTECLIEIIIIIIKTPCRRSDMPLRGGRHNLCPRSSRAGVK